MKNYEITVRPLSEEAKATGFEPFTREVDAFVLSASTGKRDKMADMIVRVCGPEIVWAAIVNLVQSLAKDFPTEFSKALMVAKESIMAGNGDKTMH